MQCNDIVQYSNIYSPFICVVYIVDIYNYILSYYVLLVNLKQPPFPVTFMFVYNYIYSSLATPTHTGRNTGNLCILKSVGQIHK